MTYLDRTDTHMANLGVAVYRVGGSVRDELLGRPAKDADYMVRGVALDDLGRLLARSVERMDRPFISKLTLRNGSQAGWRFGARGLGSIEVMLPRTDVARKARAGENAHVAFDVVIDPSLTLEDDAKRRDFTFNALYLPVGSTLDPNDYRTGEVLDPTGRGLYDLSHKLIHTTHPDSFRDDPLRTLRALRFVSTLDYDLATAAEEQMVLHARAVTGLSAKGYASGTVLDELKKLLMGQCPAKALRAARDTGVLGALLPELVPMLGFEQGSRYHDMTTDEHVFTALETAAHVDAPLRVRMALLFHDSGKPETAWVGADGRKHYYRPSPAVWAKLTNQPVQVVEFCEDQPEDHEVVGARIWRAAATRLNADRKFRDEVEALITNHMVKCEKADPVRVRRDRVRLGDEFLRDLYLMRMCDLSGKGNKNTKFLANMAAMEAARATAEQTEVPAGAGDLAINGKDVMALGASGPDVGRILHAVLDEVVCQPDALRLDRDWQLGRAEALR